METLKKNEKENKPEIEIISEHTDVKEGDKREGIKIYGDKPLEENGENLSEPVLKPTVEQIRRREEILQRIALLEKSFKSTNYVGDKSLIEEEILQLENELRKNPSDRKVSDGKIKTSKELAMEGKISWKEKDDAKVNQINKTTNIDIKFNNLNEEDKKFIEELKKANYDDDQIKNILEKRIKNVNPVINTQEEVIDNKEIKEKKEKYSREEFLNAAEIFCKFNSAAYYKDPEERRIAEERALVGLKAEHSEREIDAAVKVSGKRNELSDLREQILRVKREYKDALDNTSVGTLVVKAKYDQQIQDITRKMRLIDNDYNPLLRELKIANLESQLKNLEKYRDHADFKEKVQDAELFALSMIQTEKIRYQDAKISANSTLNPKIWDYVKNGWKRVIGTKLFQGYAKMGRGKRMAISAAMIGASSILVPVTLTAGAIALVGGGVGGYFLSKKVAQPLARKAYEHDSAKTLREQQEEMIGAKGVEKKVKNKGENKEKWWKFWKKSNEGSEEKEIVGAKGAADEMKLLEQLARGEINSAEKEKILGKIADFNIALCDKYTDRMRKDKKYYVANNVLGTVAAGLVAGRGARMMAGWIVGPGVLDIAGTSKAGGGIIEQHPPKAGATPDNIPPKGGNTVPESPDLKGEHVLPEIIVTPKPDGLEINEDVLKMATVGKGEGIQHVLIRQLEANPAKFGFNGDVTDKMALHKWAGTQADLISIDQGYKGGGTEAWIRDMGEPGPKGNPAFVLDVDASGKPSINEFYDGKPSGTGGLNSPYEYSHASPTSQRYISALDTPDQTRTEFVDTSIITEQISDKSNSFLHGLIHENLNELSGNIPNYATVLDTSMDKVHSALLGLENTKNIVGNISKIAIEHPEQARLLSVILEAEPKLSPDAQVLKNLLDAINNSNK